jgi:hypothetical protein
MTAYQIGDCTAAALAYGKCQNNNTQCPTNGQPGGCCCEEYKNFSTCSNQAFASLLPLSAPNCDGLGSGETITCKDDNMACVPTPVTTTGAVAATTGAVAGTTGAVTTTGVVSTTGTTTGILTTTAVAPTTKASSPAAALVSGTVVFWLAAALAFLS